MTSPKVSTSVQSFTAASLSEFYHVLSLISDLLKPARREQAGEPLWFRGHMYEHYTLLPTLFRNSPIAPQINEKGSYNQVSLREELRYQNFKSRVFHNIHSNPSSRIEWQELYQHYRGQTRLLDWTESARTALSFALEAYLTPRDTGDLRQNRAATTPVVWVLDPKALNRSTYEFFSREKDNSLAKAAFEDIFSEDEIKKQSKDICDELREQEKLYFSADMDKQIDGIISLCVLESYRDANQSRLKSMVKRREMNPFFYLALRYYADGLPVKAENPQEILPPLAVLNPYHSERIRAQRGTFTVFPNYMMAELNEQLCKIGQDPRPLETQSLDAGYLYSIRILDPATVARDLLLSGERTTEIYPEIDHFVQTIEGTKYFL